MTGLILFGISFLVFNFNTLIPYDESLVKIEEDNDMLISHYYGEGFYSISTTGPFQLEIDGQEQNIVFLYYTKTISHSPNRKLFKSKGSHEECNFTFPLDKKENIDAVYYTEFESISNISSKKTNSEQELYWKELMENGDLIWRR